jgi:uncharacterized protein with HEPN domain
MVIEACLYNIQVIGDAVNQLAEDVKNANPQIPWMLNTSEPICHWIGIRSKTIYLGLQTN